ncbi:MAG TPA: phage protein Gp27 family protein [Allosphingosinicella sp.]|jgi:hypothetical protein
MGQRSSIDRLPPDARVQVDQAIHDGATIDEIVGLLLDLSDQGKLPEVPSRSAVGRYSKEFRQLAARQRDVSSVAKAFAGEFGSEEDHQVKLLLQMATTTLTRIAMSTAMGEDEQLPALKDAAFLAKSIKDLVSAAKIDVDREAKIRAETAAAVKAAAAEAAASAVRAAGASDESIRRVRAEILGIEL